MEKKTIIVSAGIIENEGKILIAQRKKDSLLEPNKWEFPGGKVEFKEEEKTEKGAKEKSKSSKKKNKKKKRPLFNDRKNWFILALCRFSLGVCIYILLLIIILKNNIY